jgi:hypothetical protein
MQYLCALSECNRVNYSLFVALRNYKMHTRNNFLIHFKYADKIFEWNDPEEIIDKLKTDCKESQNCTWVVKFPFKTNKDQLKFVNTFEELKKVIVKNYDLLKSRLSFLVIWNSEGSSFWQLFTKSRLITKIKL